VNLALGAIIIAILLIPPLIFYYSYKAGAFSKSVPKFSIVEYLLSSAVISLVVHGAVIRLLNLDIDFELLFRILSGNMSEKFMVEIRPKMPSYFFQFIIYISGVCGCSSIAGFVVSFIVRSKRLRSLWIVRKLRGNEAHGNNLRYFNKWWYYFNLYKYHSAYAYLRNENPNVFVTVLYEGKDVSILYEGILFDWIADGEVLDRIYLTNASKRLFSKKSDSGEIDFTEEEKKNIEPQGVFCIPYAKISNMHIHFMDQAISNESEMSSSQIEEVSETGNATLISRSQSW